MLIREHKGSLRESMRTVEMIGNFTIDVQAYVFAKLRRYLPEGTHANNIELILSPIVHDDRVNWDTVIVSVKDYGVFGMINQYPLDYTREKK